ncbi:MAG: hypothetical protein ACQES4_12555 [Bacillota bacterium]
MILLKVFLSLIISLAFLMLIGGCGLINRPGNAESDLEASELPGWLKLSHRQSGALNFDYEPLDIDDEKAAEENDQEDEEKEDVSSNSGSSSNYRHNPTGSPYKPGTIDDMIWQQKQKDKQQ